MQSTPPLVSILIPVYRVESYIVRCIDSVLTQDYPNLEIIIVDDASPDRSIELLKRHLECHPSAQVYIHTHPTNQGSAAVRATALAAARGEYILYLDSDDYLASNNTISQLVDLALRTGADMVTSNYIGDYRHHQRTFVVASDALDFRTYALNILNGRVPGFLWNKFIRRSLISPDLFHTGQDILEDVGALIPCLMNYPEGRVTHLNAPTVHYTQYNSGSLTSSTSLHKIQGLSALLQRLEAYLTQMRDSEVLTAMELLKIRMQLFMLQKSAKAHYDIIRSSFNTHEQYTVQALPNLLDRLLYRLQMNRNGGATLGYYLSLLRRMLQWFYHNRPC